jgi:hypothetical protein
MITTVDELLIAVQAGALPQEIRIEGAILRGADLVDADLRGADLRGADLVDAILRGAILVDADLRGADLQGTDLVDAILRGAILVYADLRGAILRGADLQGADLRGAILVDADLRGADLRGADLQGADLRGAILRGADLREIHNLAPLVAATLNICPQGTLMVFKSVWLHNRENGIACLRIEEGTPRSNATGRQCRAASAHVISLETADGTSWEGAAVSKYDACFLYTIGEVATPHEWCEDRWVECAGGIHFYLTREEAANER